MSALETPKDRDEAIEMIARIAVEYPHRVREIIEAAEKLGLQLVPTAALAPFLAMTKACENLHEHEAIAARGVGGGTNRALVLDVRDFRALTHWGKDNG